MRCKAGSQCSADDRGDSQMSNRCRWYDTSRWQKRRRYQLAKEPLCRMCAVEGKVTVATIVDHVIPHRHNRELFYFGELQSLCLMHHNQTKKQLENKGYVNDIGKDGWPIDRNHPVNRANK